MTDRERVDELLDRWESAAAAEPGLSPSEYLGRETRPHPPGVTAQFLYRAAALARVGRQLNAFRPPTSAATALVPAFEPVPGYRLERLLGSGGFGQVWRAVGPGGVPAALKFVPLGRAVSAAEWRSVRLMKEVRHPHLIAVHAAWEAHGYLVIAMEPADGSLADRLRECVGRGLPGVPRDELFVYLADAAAALDYLNEPRHQVEDGRVGGIQHRDVKPQNLLALGGRVKVADFGLARALTGGVTGHTGGMTLDYAAPEFFEGRTSVHSDQYSLAVTYCRLRGGRLPFAGSPAEVTLGHLKREPDLSTLPAAERPAVARALAKRPESRWPSCTAFVAALRQSLVVTSPETAVPGRRRVVWLGAAALVATATVVLTVVVLRNGRERASDAPDDGNSARTPAVTKSGVTAGRLLRRIDVGACTSAVAVSPDGRYAACGGGADPFSPELALFDLAAGTRVRAFTGDAVAGRHHGRVSAVSFSPDGRTLCAAGSGGAGDLIFWRVENGRPVGRATAIPAVYAGAAPVVLAVDYGTKLMTVREGGAERAITVTPRTVTGIAISPDATLALALTDDGQAAVWEVASGREVGRWDVPSDGHDRPGFTADGRRVLIGTRMYAVPDGREVSRLAGSHAGLMSAALASTGRRAVAATADGTVIVWDTDTGKEVCRLADGRGEIRSVAFAPGGARVVALAAVGGLYVWEVPAD